MSRLEWKRTLSFPENFLITIELLAFGFARVRGRTRRESPITKDAANRAIDKRSESLSR